jgi:hypothetical protein
MKEPKQGCRSPTTEYAYFSYTGPIEAALPV